MQNSTTWTLQIEIPYGDKRFYLRTHLRGDRWILAQVAIFRCWIASCLRLQNKTGYLLD